MNTSVHKIKQHLEAEIGKKVFGSDEVIHSLTIAWIAGGHILLQGLPGQGKTLIAKTFSEILGGDFQRIQCTSDLLPSDLTGLNIYNSNENRFEFIKGPLFADVVLVDEINRTGPKTQSALLEAMEERRITVDKTSYALSDNFLVIASQNPLDFEGTFPLPESQLDRFLMRLDISYPNLDTEKEILRSYGKLGMGGHVNDTPLQTLDMTLLHEAREEANKVHVADSLLGYIHDIANASRQHQMLRLGISARGSLALLRCARIEAALDGAEFVTPDHIKQAANRTLAHRIVPSTDAMLEGLQDSEIVASLLEKVAVPRE